MDQQTDFTFYSELKHEDAEPFLGDSLLVVADGLGGAGSFVHAVDWGTEDRERRFFEEAFGDFIQDHGLEREIKQWTRLITDGVPDTSALWASRIVIARFVYAMTKMERFSSGDLQEKEVREKLSEFILAGLNRVASRFSLTTGRYSNQMLLPTTLAAIRYTESEASVTAEAIWAGDSRCYALTKSGLKPISEDDEDASGSITNLFCAGGRKADLHYRRVVLPKPCALLVVSDGTFDPFDPHSHFGLEYTLFHTMIGCKSAEELRETLKNVYDEYHADDATMAFAAFGFSGYEDMQYYFGERAQYIEEVWTEFCGRRAELEVKNDSAGEAADYLVSRTSDKFDAIVRSLVLCALEGGSDICLGEKFIRAVEEAKRSVIEEEKSALGALRQAALAKVREEVLRRRERAFEFVKIPNFSELKAVLSAEEYERIKNFRQQEIFGAARTVREKRKKRPGNERLSEERFHAEAKEIRAAIEETLHTLDGLIGKEEYRSAFFAAYERVRKIHDAMRTCEEGRRQEAEKTAAWAAGLESAEKKLLALINEYLSFALKDPALIGQFFKRDFLEECGWKNIPEKTVGELNEAIVQRVLSALLPNKADAVRMIVGYMEENFGQTSAIDGYYNATRLQNFRNYCKLQRAPDPSLEELECQVRKLEKEYGEM